MGIVLGIKIWEESGFKVLRKWQVVFMLIKQNEQPDSKWYKERNLTSILWRPAYGFGNEEFLEEWELLSRSTWKHQSVEDLQLVYKSK